jgi:hypothetical protein
MGVITMKKYILILVAVIGFAINANAIVWRGTHKVCGGGAELTLYQTGKMVFWYDGSKYEGTYSIDDGYVNLFEDGRNIFSFKYSYTPSTNTLNWVDFEGTKLTKGGC